MRPSPTIFTITVNDGNGGTDTQDVTINITGANDVPVITQWSMSIGDITEGTTLSDTGSITFADLDLTDLPTATEVTQSVNTTKVGGLTGAQQTAIENAFSISPDALNANNGTINWTYTITEGELDFLAAGETVTAVFTITVNDGNGGTDTQNVTINITGSNDAPVITPSWMCQERYHRGYYPLGYRFDHLYRSRPDRSADGHRSDPIGEHYEGRWFDRCTTNRHRECVQHQPRCSEHQQRHYQLGLHHHRR